jgi:hypothetical protein
MRITLLIAALASSVLAGQSAPLTVRVYILDCGRIVGLDPRFSDLKTEEVKGSLELANPCYLVVHPRGTLMWDVGEIPDMSMPMVGPGSQGRSYRVNGKLLPQLAAIGYTPKDIQTPCCSPGIFGTTQRNAHWTVFHRRTRIRSKRERHAEVQTIF